MPRGAKMHCLRKNRCNFNKMGQDDRSRVLLRGSIFSLGGPKRIYVSVSLRRGRSLIIIALGLSAMNKESSLTLNALSVVWALGALAYAHGEDGQTNAFAIAYSVPAVITLFNAYRAAGGDDKQVLAGPVTSVVLLAVFGSFGVLDSPLRADLALLLTAVPFGTSVLGALVSGLARLPTLLAGTVVGWAGLLLTTAAISHHLPGAGLFIALDSLTKIDPFHLEYLRGPSNAELDDMRKHNAANVSGSGWKVMLFALQTIVLCAWDALILSVGVWLMALVASPVMKIFAKRV